MTVTERIVDGIVYVVVFDGQHRHCDADLLTAAAIPRKQRGDPPPARRRGPTLAQQPRPGSVKATRTES